MNSVNLRKGPERETTTYLNEKPSTCLFGFMIPFYIWDKKSALKQLKRVSLGGGIQNIFFPFII